MSTSYYQYLVCKICWTLKRIIGDCDFSVLFVFIYSVALCFLHDVFTMLSGKPMSAVSVFMTGNYLCQPGGRVSGECVKYIFSKTEKIIKNFVSNSDQKALKVFDETVYTL